LPNRKQQIPNELPECLYKSWCRIAFSKSGENLSLHDWRNLLKSPKLNSEPLNGKSQNFNNAKSAITSKSQCCYQKMTGPATANPQRANAEISCAAAVLLVKPVRVGVSLDDLLTFRPLLLAKTTRNY